MPFVEMTEEQIARKFAYDQGLAMIDWATLTFLVENAPKGTLIFDTSKCTYTLAETKEVKV